jgi:hypothetical protein
MSVRLNAEFARIRKEMDTLTARVAAVETMSMASRGEKKAMLGDDLGAYAMIRAKEVGMLGVRVGGVVACMIIGAVGVSVVLRVFQII